MKLLSEACEYALRAAVWLAQRPGEPQKVRQIAEGPHAAPGYLVKVLQAMTKAGILSAQRGTGGGFSLRRDPASLSVLDVIGAVDALERIRTCPLGLAEHGTNLCAMHRRIDDAIAAIRCSFAASSIADLLSEPSSSTPLYAVPTARPAPAPSNHGPQ